MSHGCIFVYGAGGHGKVLADIAIKLGHTVAGFIDDGVRPGQTILHGRSTDVFYAVCGDGNWLLENSDQFTSIGMGVGSNRIRHEIQIRLTERKLRIATLAHPSAIISPFAEIGVGTVVMPLAVINVCAQVGLGCIVNTAAVVEHDAVVGDFAHISPNATMAGESRLGGFSHLGTGAVILPGVSVGSHCIVGAGAVVTRNVADGVVVAGVPARKLRNCT